MLESFSLALSLPASLMCMTCFNSPLDGCLIISYSNTGDGFCNLCCERSTSACVCLINEETQKAVAAVAADV